MTDAIFGNLILWTDVGNAVQQTLQKWYPTYLARVSRLIGQPSPWLPPPGSYVITNDANHFPEDQAPAVVIAIPGTAGRPIRDGNRNYRAIWDLRLTIFVQSTDRAATESLAGYYGAATRELLLNKRSLGGFAEGLEWYGETFGVRVADRDQRTLFTCENRFSVDVRDVVTTFGGPPAPITSIPADWPQATVVKVNLTPVAPD